LKKVYILFVFLMTLLIQSVYAETTYETEKFEYIITNGEITITSCLDYESEIIEVPKEINGKPVVAVGGFTGNLRKVKEVILPEGVIEISDMGFYYCDSLETITLPSSLEKIGRSAFYNCEKLTNIHIPENVSIIGDEGSFRNCFSLNTLTVADGNTNFSSLDNVLYNYDKTSLILYPAGKEDIKFTIPSSVKEIKNYAFYNCDNLTKILLPENLEIIGDSAIFYCDGLETIHITKNVSYIGETPFGSCNNLKEITIDESNTYFSIENGMLMSYNKEELLFYIPNRGGTLVIPNSIESISKSAFKYSSLEEVIIPSNTLFIGEEAFYNSALKKIYIHKNTKEIGKDVFGACYDLSNIYFSGTSEEWESLIINNISDECINQATIEFEYDCKIIAGGSDINNSSWILYSDGKVVISGNGKFGKIDFGENINKITSIEIKSGITSIPERAFEGNHYVSEIILPDTITEIGYRAFAACLNVNKYIVNTNNNYYTSDELGVLYDKRNCTLIQFPVGNKNIGNYSIKEGVMTIGDSSFAGGQIGHLQIPDTVKTIEKSAFQYFSTDELVIPSNVNTISEYGFYGCGIKKITFNEGLQVIGSRAFDYSDNLTEINIPNSVISIGSQAFDGCSNLEKITVSSNNQYYCAEQGVLFNKNKSELIQYPIGSKESVYVIPNTVTTVGSLSFWACRNIKEIIIPSSVAIIGNQAFAYCTSLEKIYCHEGLNTIEAATFNNCIALNDIYYEGTKKQWENIYIGLNDDYFSNANYHFELHYPIGTSGTIEAFLNNSKIHIKSNFDLKDSVVLIAEYDEDNRFRHLLPIEIDTSKNYVCIDKSLPEYGYFKVFVWQSLKNLKPQANSVTLSEDLHYNTNEYEEIKLLHLINHFGSEGVTIAIKEGYYEGALKESFLDGETDKISIFISEAGTIYDYSEFERLLKEGIKKYYREPSSGGMSPGWS